MSGAAANAAARRRRLAPTQPNHQIITPEPKQLEQAKTNIPLTPINILKMHETRISNLETENNKLTKQLLESQNSNFSGQSGHLTSRVEKLELMLTKNEESTNILDKQENSNISELELEICELKKLVTKIQTFAMETNLSLMKYKSDTTFSGINIKEATTEEATTQEATTEEATIEEATTEEATIEEATTEEATTEEATTEEATTEEATTEENITISFKSIEKNMESKDLQEYFANQINK